MFWRTGSQFTPTPGSHASTPIKLVWRHRRESVVGGFTRFPLATIFDGLGPAPAFVNGGPGRDRTSDQLVMSQLLYH